MRVRGFSYYRVTTSEKRIERSFQFQLFGAQDKETARLQPVFRMSLYWAPILFSSTSIAA
jgi:hypothetical protein